MTYLQAMTGHGGWPLNVWLTPDLKPFFGGSYFPATDKQGRPGFGRILQALADGWQHERGTYQGEGERVVAALSEAASRAADEARVELTPSLCDLTFQRGSRYYAENFDPEWGGFGGAPKFPQPGILQFLLRYSTRYPDNKDGTEARRMAAHTLSQMCRGGVHDHVGGGFHRYSVDTEWFIPHFEKMLYDQAQLVSAALEAWRCTRDGRFAWMARDVLGYVLQDLALPVGAFCSAEDADSEVPTSDGSPSVHREGAFYVWSWAELEKTLGGDLAFFAAHFGVRPGGNVDPERDPHQEFTGLNHLAQRQSLAETAQRFNLTPARAEGLLLYSLSRLHEVRSRRPRPLLDRKVVTAWNGLLLSALARASVLPAAALADERASYRLAAARLAAFLSGPLYDAVSGRLYRSFCDGQSGAWGVAEDYAFTIQGLLDWYEVSFDTQVLRFAVRLQEELDRGFLDRVGGAYFNSSEEASDLVLRLKEDYDGAEPAASSVAALNLLRLAALFERPEWRHRGLDTIEAFRSRWEVVPQALPTMMLALDFASASEPCRIALTGDPNDPRFAALVAELHSLPWFPRVLAAAHSSSESAWARSQSPWLATLETSLSTTPSALVCVGGRCLPAVFTPDELRKALQGQLSNRPHRF